MVLHVGGNALGLRCSRELARDIKLHFFKLWSYFPDTIFVWSDIVAQSAWRLARSFEKINRARIKVNEEVAKNVVHNGGLPIHHRDLEEETCRFLRRDGVHLNAVGIDLCQLGLQDGIFMFGGLHDRKVSRSCAVAGGLLGLKRQYWKKYWRIRGVGPIPS